MTQTPNGVSSLISSQLPAFITENNPNFAAFIRAYYEWLEKSDQGAVLYHAKNLLAYRDIDAVPTADFINEFDKSVDNFLTYFKNDFLPFFPNEIALDERKLIKLAREYYAEKGTEESTKFLFRVLYNKDLEIYYPKQNILRASDGKWQRPQAIKLILSPGNENFDVSLLIKHQGVGSVSNATCIIENATKTIDRGLNREIVEVYISNINKLFSVGENLIVGGVYSSNNAPFTFAEKIIGSISNLTINPKNPGLKYRGLEKDGLGNITYQGDPVVFYGGLANTAEATKAVAYVNNVTTGQIKSIEAVAGGYGYRTFPESTVTVVSTSGTGANVIIQEINQTRNISVNYDSINFKETANIGDVNYFFDNIAVSNANTTLAEALTFHSIIVGSVSGMNVVNGGSGFKTVPTYNILSFYDTDFSTGEMGLAPYLLEVQPLQDLGIIANVTILSGGSGYSNVRDTIIFTTSIGYGGTFYFSTDGSGKITSVTVLTPGEGYPHPISSLQLILANSANTQNAASGTGASLVAYGLNEGASFVTAVADIGRIVDFRVVSRGFDYVSTPSVSLRVLDVLTTHTFTGNEGLLEDMVVYQGANANSASFTAHLDRFGSDLSNSTIRLYNYTGAIDTSQNLVLGLVNTTVVVSTVYGNGMAKANVEFLNGIINYPGFYLNTDGQPSADQYLENYTKYHNYSYIIQIDKSLNDYRDSLLALAHPSGMELLGAFSVTDTQTSMAESNNTVSYLQGLTGNVTTNAFDPSGNVSGLGTSFLISANVGDMIVIDSTDSIRRSAKVIENILSNTELVVESNTAFVGGFINVNVSSNIAVTTNVSGMVVANDNIAYTYSNTTYTAEVVNVGEDGLTITLNTDPSITQNSLMFEVYPTLINASYQIINF